jgi:hypothetical protein
MIRYLIITLILANILYFFWANSIGKVGYSSPTKLVENIPELVLLASKRTDAYQSKNTNRQSSCYTFGPFNNEKTARDIAKKINDFGLATVVNKQKTMQTLNFLVYLQPLSTRKDAEKIIADISKHEIKKYKIIDSGPYKNAISLGSFENLDKARRHSEYVRFLGYDAKYTEQKTQKELFWVEYDEPFSSNAPVMRWTNEIDPRASAQKIPKACLF